MKSITLRDLPGKSAEFCTGLRIERGVVVTSNGRPIAVLSAVNEANLTGIPFRHPSGLMVLTAEHSSKE